MIPQGGGVTRHEGVDKYIDLVVHDLTELEAAYPQTLQLFTAFAQHDQGRANCGYVELSKDSRLQESLSGTSSGRKLFKKISQGAPVITVSTRILGDPTGRPAIILRRRYRAEYRRLHSIDHTARSRNPRTGLQAKNSSTNGWRVRRPVPGATF